MASFLFDVSDTAPLDTFRQRHGSSYSEIVNGCCDALGVVWSEMGLQSKDVKTELMNIVSNVTQVWQSAVREAENQRDAFHQRIREVESEMRGIQAQLGEQLEMVVLQPEMTLRQRLDAVTKLKDQFIEMKRQRITQFTEVIEKTEAIRSQFGQAQEEKMDFESPHCNITIANLDFLKCELESFCAERSRRMERLDSLWRPLRLMCSELGEDPTEMAKTVHPTLEFMEQSLSGMGTTFSVERQPSLSETLFSLLEEKLTSLISERSRRENELLHMRETLLSLWDALQTSTDDLDRNILTRLMEGPARLHRRTFEKAREEIHRQETAKARILKDLIGKKLEEIENVYNAGHLPLPTDVQEIMKSNWMDGNVGHYASTLAHLTRLLTKATAISEKRSEILTMIQDVQNAESEVKWLAAYEHDGDRYKGRDCNRKLQRAIRAGKLRERLPALAERLVFAMMEWERTEHQPFLFDGVDYRQQLTATYEINPSQKFARSGRKTPNGRRSAIPEFPTPSHSARGLAKHRMTPSRSNSRSEGRSMIARPQTSIGHYPAKENGFEHLLKDTQTDYHPLQERLDRLLGQTASPVKSGIPTPTSVKLGMSPMEQVPNNDIQNSSEDEVMEDIADPPKMSLPPPRLNLNALNNRSALDLSQRRPTF